MYDVDVSGGGGDGGGGGELTVDVGRWTLDGGWRMMDGGWWMVDRRYWATDSEPVSIVVGPHLAPISVRNDMTIRPAGLPPMLTSKNTRGFSSGTAAPAGPRPRRGPWRATHHTTV